MEFLYSITVYKCGVYNIPEKLQMITTFSTYYGTDLVFPVFVFLGSVSYDKQVYKILLENLFLFSRFSHLKSLKMSLSMTFDGAWQATTTT